MHMPPDASPDRYAIIAGLLHQRGVSFLFSIIQAAGWPIWPLVACSILALALIIERFISLKTAKVAPPRLLDEVLTVSRNGIPSTDMVAQLERNSALGEVLASGFRALNANPSVQRGRPACVDGRRRQAGGAPARTVPQRAWPRSHRPRR